MGALPTAAASGVAEELAGWAYQLAPSEEERELARRSLLDTVAVAQVGAAPPIRELAGLLQEAGQWAAFAHVLDFDDLHLPSTTHVSAVCVPAALAAGGGERAFLAGAGVMARLGCTLGWPHYRAGWHATCTVGAPAAAVAAGVGIGLDAERLAVAIALAIPAAGGVQRAFGTHAKALQVGFVADAGVRAAQLAAAGASADPRALDDWLALMGGDPARMPRGVEAIPGGLAIKLFPCCYALQRPIAATRSLRCLPTEEVTAIRVTTPRSSLAPLIHDRPLTGLQAKFSLRYAIAATLLDGWPGLQSFSDEAVARPSAPRLMDLMEVIDGEDDGQDLLAGQVRIEAELGSGERREAELDLPPGAPGRPPTGQELEQKLRSCVGTRAEDLKKLSWESAAGYLRQAL